MSVEPLLPTPPRIVDLSDDEWLAAMRGDPETGGQRTSVYADSNGREMRLTHPGLIPPAAIIVHDGVPAAPVEFILKGDDVHG